MHQHRRALNFTPCFLLALTRLLTSKVLVNVTIGIGELIQSSNASALFVSWGLNSVFIRQIYFLSHLLATATVMCSLMLVHGLLTLGVSLTVFPYQSGDFALGDFGYLLLSILFEMIVYFAISAIVTFFAVNAKNVGICILLYLATAIGSTIIGSIFQVAGMFVESGTIAYNVIEFINACNIYTSSLIGSGISYTAKEVLYILVAPVVIGTGCTLLGIRMFARKNLK